MNYERTKMKVENTILLHYHSSYLLITSHFFRITDIISININRFHHKYYHIIATLKSCHPLSFVKLLFLLAQSDWFSLSVKTVVKFLLLLISFTPSLKCPMLSL